MCLFACRSLTSVPARTRRSGVLTWLVATLALAGCDANDTLHVHWGPCRPQLEEVRTLHAAATPAPCPSPPTVCWSVRLAQAGYSEIFNACTGEERIHRNDEGDDPTKIEVRNLVTGEGWLERYQMRHGWVFTEPSARKHDREWEVREHPLRYGQAQRAWESLSDEPWDVAAFQQWLDEDGFLKLAPESAISWADALYLYFLSKEDPHLNPGAVRNAVDEHVRGIVPLQTATPTTPPKQLSLKPTPPRPTRFPHLLGKGLGLDAELREGPALRKLREDAKRKDSLGPSLRELQDAKRKDSS